MATTVMEIPSFTTQGFHSHADINCYMLPKFCWPSMQGAVRVKAVMAVSSVIVSALLAIDAQLILLALDRSCSTE